MTTLKENLAQLKARAEEIKPAVEAGDEKAMAEATDLVEQIENAKSAIAKADEFEATLKGIGAVGEKAASAKKSGAKTLGDFVVEGVKSKGIPQKSMVNYGTFTKTAGDVMSAPDAIQSAVAQVEERVYEGPRRRLTVADLFGQETTTRSAVTYFVENETVEGTPAGVAQGATKPGVTFGDPEPVTESVKKIAAVYKETDELLDDLPWLASSINNRGIYMHGLVKEDAILNGDGKSNNVTGVLQRTGVQAIAQEDTDANAADAIFRAMTAVNTESGFTADAIVINPADYQTLRLAKDSNNQYYGGGFFQGSYGNGSVMDTPSLWGVPTVVTSAIAKGTVLVGAFKLGGSVIERKGLTVEMANQNEDDFINNRISIRIEERLALAIRYPKAFAKVTLSGVSTASATSSKSTK